MSSAVIGVDTAMDVGGGRAAGVAAINCEAVGSTGIFETGTVEPT